MYNDFHKSYSQQPTVYLEDKAHLKYGQRQKTYCREKLMDIDSLF